MITPVKYEVSEHNIMYVQMNQESLATSWKAMKVSSQDRLAVPIYKTYIQIIQIRIRPE
jgi:hypothetical protein